MAERSRPFWPTVALGAGASALAAVAAGRTWATAESAVGGESAGAAVSGSDVAPLALALALVALASWGALLVLRRRARRGVAVLGLLSSLAVAGISATSAGAARDRVGELVLGESGSAAVDLSTWFYLTPLAAAVAALLFVAALLWARGWPEMSGRYDAPVARAEDGGAAEAPQDETDLWRALDDGRDPTS